MGGLEKNQFIGLVPYNYSYELPPVYTMVLAVLERQGFADIAAAVAVVIVVFIVTVAGVAVAAVVVVATIIGVVISIISRWSNFRGRIVLFFFRGGVVPLPGVIAGVFFFQFPINKEPEVFFTFGVRGVILRPRRLEVELLCIPMRRSQHLIGGL